MEAAQRRAFGARLRESRSEAGLSQRDVARDLRVTQQGVSAWERGAALPTLSQCCKLAQLYGASLDYLALGLRTIPASLVNTCMAARPADAPIAACQRDLMLLLAGRHMGIDQERAS